MISREQKSVIMDWFSTCFLLYISHHISFLGMSWVHIKLVYIASLTLLTTLTTCYTTSKKFYISDSQRERERESTWAFTIWFKLINENSTFSTVKSPALHCSLLRPLHPLCTHKSLYTYIKKWGLQILNDIKLIDCRL